MGALAAAQLLFVRRTRCVVPDGSRVVIG